MSTGFDITKKARVLVLGSGTSTGVPLIGCSCPVCTSSDPRDSRLRCGYYFSCDGFGLLLDCSCDFRQQALRYKIPNIDAVLLTHCHADHVLGMDDLRRYNTTQKSEIPLYCFPSVAREMLNIFSYAFYPPPLPEGMKMYRPQLTLHELTNESVQIGPFRVCGFFIPHGPIQSTAFEICVGERRVVVASDCGMVTPELEKAMQGADIVFLDGLRDRPHPSHLTLDLAAEFLRKSQTKCGRLVHIGHDILASEIEKRYPEPIKPAYDGELLEF